MIRESLEEIRTGFRHKQRHPRPTLAETEYATSRFLVSPTGDEFGDRHLVVSIRVKNGCQSANIGPSHVAGNERKFEWEILEHQVMPAGQ
jgi:hypothetical protein